MKRGMFLYMNCGVFVLLLATGCKTEKIVIGQDFEVSAAVLFAVGQVTVDGKNVRTGDIIAGGKEIEVGRSSRCHLQIRESAAMVQIWLDSGAKLELTGRALEKSRTITAAMKQGNALYKIDKLTADERIRVTSPSSQASVRGTKFELSLEKNVTIVSVYEGSVAVRPRLAALEALPPEVCERGKICNAIVQALEKTEQILGPAGRIEMDDAHVEGALAASPELKSALDAPAVQKLKGSRAPAPEDIKSAVNALDAPYDDSQKRGRLTESFKKIKAPASRQIKDDELKKKLKQFDNLIALHRSQLADASKLGANVAELNRKRQEALMGEIEKVMNQTAETLVLKNGRRIRGVIFSQGDAYIVLTPDGRTTYRKNQVDRTEF